jgi:uncharacterized protein involved in response to NO
MITRGEQMLELRKQRMASSIPFLRGGFRPFFTGGAAWSLVALVLWIGALTGAIALPTQFDPLAWHRHEMLFGFVGAVIAGFLLTAIPNWTGRLPIAGMPLAALFGLWLVARFAVLSSSVVGPLPAAFLDVGFYLVLAALAAREVLAAQNRNVPVVAMVLLLGIANGVDHAAAAGMLTDDIAGVRAGIGLVILMISLIGGRIVPSFTRNWLARQGAKTGLPTQPGRFDLLTIGVTAMALASWLAAWPDELTTGLLLVSAAILQAARLVRWRGYRTFRDPLVVILHVGYGWVPIGLLLLGLGLIGTDVPRTVAIHALTAGAMATMILAVMTRATLGHTGRELRADAGTTLLYALVTLGAALRVAAPVLPFDYLLLIKVSGALWAGAFLVFLIAYGPKLLGPRPDGRL